MGEVILDMDPGIDDALALMLALRSPEIELLAVTTVAGNAPLGTTTRNACRVLECMGERDVPVFPGAAQPLKQALLGATDYHGDDGLGNCGLQPPTLQPQGTPAWDAIALHAYSRPGHITLVATGPLTNVAIAFERYPDLADRLARLVVMGGAFDLTAYGKGNRTASAEFNIWQDPEAAARVFASATETFVVGLDVSTDPSVCLARKHVEHLKLGQGACAGIAAGLTGYAVSRHGRCELHDPLALAVVLDPSLFEFMTSPVHVAVGTGRDRGTTRVLDPTSAAAQPPLHIAVHVNGPRFLDLFLSRLLER